MESQSDRGQTLLRTHKTRIDPKFNGMVYRARESYNDPDDSFKAAPRLNEQKLENNEKRARVNAKGYRQKPKRGSMCKGGRIIV